MPHTDTSPAIEQYLSAVRAQIRNKRARSWAADELADHIEDQRQAFLDAGDSEEEATEKALKEMGDPVEAGTQLDRVHRPAPSREIILLAAGLTLLGIILRQVLKIHETGRLGPLLPAIGGSALMFLLLLGVYTLDYSRIFKRPALPFQLLLGLYVFINLVPRLSLRIPELFRLLLEGIYPALPELLTISFAGVLFAYRRKGLTGFWLCIGHSILFYLIAEKDYVLSEPWLLIFLGLCLLELGYAVWKGWFGIHKAWLLCPAAALFSVFLLTFNRRLWALRRFIWQLQTPDLSPDDRYSWHLYSLREILDGIKFLGSSDSRQLTDFIEKNHNHGFDLLSITGLYGVIVPLGIGLLLAVLLFLLWRKTRSTKMALGHLLALTAVALLTIQTIHFFVFNFSVQIFNTRGLPFLFDGNTSILSGGLLTGLLLSIFYNQNLVREPAVRREKGTGGAIYEE